MLSNEGILLANGFFLSSEARLSNHRANDLSRVGLEAIRMILLHIRIPALSLLSTLCVIKLAAGKAAPFTYHGRVRYQSHQGSKPMSIVFGLDAAVGSSPLD